MEDCNKRGDKIKELGLPTNFGLIGRLNGCSQRMSAFLNGSTWRRNIYTSGWGLAFMEAVARGSADAD